MKARIHLAVVTIAALISAPLSFAANERRPHGVVTTTYYE